MMSPDFHIIFSLLRVAMNFIEDIRISQECTEAGFSAEINCPATIFDAGEISRISIAEFSPTEGDKAWISLLFQKMFRHLKLISKPSRIAYTKLFCLLNFRDENLKWTDC